jgi:hypothetical protein
MEVTFFSHTSIDFQAGGKQSYLLIAGFLSDLFLDPEDEDDIFLRNIG